MSWLVVVAALSVAAPTPKRSAAAAPSPEGQVETPEARAAQIKSRGDAAMVAGRPGDALRDYEEAMALSTDPALIYNRARALQALERYPEATRQLEKFAKVASPELRARVPRLDALMVEVRSRSSALELSCDVEGAEVRVGNLLLGKTPLKRVDLNAGKVTLTVTHPDYHPFTRSIDLPGASVAMIEVSLSRLATTGLLRVSASVPGAQLTIDDAPRGTTPFEGYLPLGTHRLELNADGYDSSSNSVVISSTEPRELTVELAATPRFYQRWYFWGAVVAAVAAGTATAVALTTERPAVEGSLGITSVGRAGN